MAASGSETIGAVVRASDRESYDMIGYAGEASIVSDEVGTIEDARLRGRVDG